MKLPSGLRDTGCTEYFRDYKAGRYDDESQIWYISPEPEVYICSETSCLVIGRPGVDFIEFCFRPGHTGVWAFSPFEGEWTRIAESLRDLERKWAEDALLL